MWYGRQSFNEETVWGADIRPHDIWHWWTRLTIFESNSRSQSYCQCAMQYTFQKTSTKTLVVSFLSFVIFPFGIICETCSVFFQDPIASFSHVRAYLYHVRTLYVSMYISSFSLFLADWAVTSLTAEVRPEVIHACSTPAFIIHSWYDCCAMWRFVTVSL